VIAVTTAIVGGLVIAAVVQHQLERPAAYGGERQTHSGSSTLSILPGLPAITIHGDPLYGPDDPWKSYLADERTCPGGEDLGRALAQQAQTMVCLVNFARRRRGLGPVVTTDILNGTSLLKAERIERCRDFNHDACGEDAALETRAAGFLDAWGENLFIAEGAWGAPRPALDGWLNSDGHRENLFRPGWRTQGIAVMKIARFGDERDVTLWVNQFGAG